MNDRLLTEQEMNEVSSINCEPYLVAQDRKTARMVVEVIEKLLDDTQAVHEFIGTPVTHSVAWQSLKQELGL